MVEKSFFKAYPGVSDDVVGKVEDPLSAAVILFDFHDPAIGERDRKTEDILEVGAPEGVYALCIIAHHRQVAPSPAKELDDFPLNVVGILVFVDKHIFDLLPELITEDFMVAEFVTQHRHEVVIVHQVRCFFIGFISAAEDFQFRQERDIAVKILHQGIGNA